MMARSKLPVLPDPEEVLRAALNTPLPDDLKGKAKKKRRTPKKKSAAKS